MKYSFVILLSLMACSGNDNPVSPTHTSIKGTWTFTSGDISATFTIGKIPGCTKMTVVSGTVILGMTQYTVVPLSAGTCQVLSELDSIAPTSIFLGATGNTTTGYNIQVKIQSVSSDFKTMISDKIDLAYYPGYAGRREQEVTITRK